MHDERLVAGLLVEVADDAAAVYEAVVVGDHLELRGAFDKGVACL